MHKVAPGAGRKSVRDLLCYIGDDGAAIDIVNDIFEFAAIEYAESEGLMYRKDDCFYLTQKGRDILR